VIHQKVIEKVRNGSDAVDKENNVQKMKDFMAPFKDELKGSKTKKCKIFYISKNKNHTFLNQVTLFPYLPEQLTCAFTFRSPGSY
jgi:hypothetical protein